jgi:hypothetical protein
VFVVRGNGQRALGEQTPTELFRPVGYPAPAVLQRHFVLSGGADFDGDGTRT